MSMRMNTVTLTAICLLSLSGLSNVLADVETAVGDKSIDVSVSGKPVMTYHTGTVMPPEGMEKGYARSGFIHPIYSPSGKVLTDDFPVGHAHQHALFSAWTRATFKHEVVDFWNQQGGTGSARHVEARAQTSSGLRSGFAAIQSQRGPGDQRNTGR